MQNPRAVLWLRYLWKSDWPPPLQIKCVSWWLVLCPARRVSAMLSDNSTTLAGQKSDFLKRRPKSCCWDPPSSKSSVFQCALQSLGKGTKKHCLLDFSWRPEVVWSHSFVHSFNQQIFEHLLCANVVLGTGDMPRGDMIQRRRDSYLLGACS